MDEGENHIKKLDIVKLAKKNNGNIWTLTKLKIENIFLGANITTPSNNVSKL
jgi:hypothetical protein